MQQSLPSQPPNTALSETRVHEASLLKRLGDGILIHVCASPPLFQKAYLNVHEFLKVFFKVLEAEWQNSYIINERNTLENHVNHLCGLGKWWERKAFQYTDLSLSPQLFPKAIEMTTQVHKSASPIPNVETLLICP